MEQNSETCVKFSKKHIYGNIYLWKDYLRTWCPRALEEHARAKPALHSWWNGWKIRQQEPSTSLRMGQLWWSGSGSRVSDFTSLLTGNKANSSWLIFFLESTTKSRRRSEIRGCGYGDSAPLAIADQTGTMPQNRVRERKRVLLRRNSRRRRRNVRLVGCLFNCCTSDLRALMILRRRQGLTPTHWLWECSRTARFSWRDPVLCEKNGSRRWTGSETEISCGRRPEYSETWLSDCTESESFTRIQRHSHDGARRGPRREHPIWMDELASSVHLI